MKRNRNPFSHPLAILLLVLGIFALPVPVFGIPLIVAAAFVHARFRARVRAWHTELEVKAVEQDRRERILAWKAL